MAKKLQTLQDIDHEIARLRQRAEEIREAEKAGVIARIQEAVDYYGITAKEIHFSRKVAGRAAPADGAGGLQDRRGGKSQRVARASAGRTKYKDEAGNTWSGFGRKPRWFIAALEAGKTEADLRA